MSRIMIIDDDAALWEVVRKYLVAEGHEVLVAGDGTEATKLLKAQRVDLVITDVYMPEMDGFELSIWLGQQRSPPKIIAMSGGGLTDKEEVLEFSARLGAERTLAKPFTRDAMVTAVRETLRS